VNRALLVAAIAGTAAGACGVVHLNPLAPGHIDVDTPPERIEERTPEPPVSSGEDITWLNCGVLAAAGADLGAAAAAQSAIGPEISLHVGESPDQHTSDGDYPVAPRQAWGLNLGWAPHPSTGRGPFYAEIQRTRLSGWLALGWAWDRQRHQTGPQLAAGFGPFFFRLTPYLEQHVTVLFGIAIKGGVSWVRSR